MWFGSSRSPSLPGRDLQPELGAEDPCKTSCQNAGSPLGSSWNVAAAPSRAAGAGARFLQPNNSRAQASPQPLGLSATPLSPDMLDTNPSLDISCILPSCPPSLSCLHPMLQQVLIELQCLTSQRNPLLGKSCSGSRWWNGSSLPPRHSRLLPVQALGVTGLLDFHPNSRGLGVHRIRPFEHLMGFYSG